MKKKSVIEKNVSLFLIVNLVVAILAFSYSIGIVSAAPGDPPSTEAPPVDTGVGSQKEDNALHLLPGETSAPSISKVPYGPPVPPGLTNNPVKSIPISSLGAKRYISSTVTDGKAIARLIGAEGTVEGTYYALNSEGKGLLTGASGLLQRSDGLYKIVGDNAVKLTSEETNALTSAKLLGADGKIASTAAPGGEAGKGLLGFIKSIYTGDSGFAGIISSAAWGLTAWGAGQLAGKFFGLSDERTRAVSMALGFGSFAGRGAFVLAKNGALGETLAGSPVATGVVVGVGVAIAVYLLTYKEESKETVTFECLPWEAPTGGASCEKCNTDPMMPCSEYRCKSLGQACGIVNAGTEEEQCVWINRKDVLFPKIKAWSEPLLDGYDYRPDNAIQPPDAGVKIIKKDSTNGCVPAFTPLRFGIETDEPAQCKIDYNRPKAGKTADEGKAIYDAIPYFMGGSNMFRYNHTEVLSLPGPSAPQNGSPVLNNDGTYSLFVRCQDANGNANLQSFVFNFCVEKSADTTPPLIVTTSILNGSPIAYNLSSVDLDVYVNEPSSCKWSKSDLAYKDMENMMQCSSSVFEMNANLLYKCKTTLTGLKNSEANTFFFRCEDQPQAPVNDRNVNSRSRDFVLFGTRTLNIISVSPNGTIKDATNVVPVNVQVETANGYKEGEAVCYYSPTGVTESYIEFKNTGTNLHSQVLNLPEGTYTYYIKCIDLGGNSDLKTTTFKVETDTSSPIVVRVFHEENKLKLITNENATCSYGIKDCNFNTDDGIQFRTIKGVEQFTDWDVDKSYYIRCVDQYGREPLSNQCSIVVKPVNFLEREVVEDNGLVA